MGFPDGGGFDWNGNGKSDAFDSFMDMKVSGSDGSDNGNEEGGTSRSPDSPYNRISNTDENKETYAGGKPLYDATKDSDGVAALKGLVVTGLCVGGVALAVSAEAGAVGLLICVFGAIALSILILKNT